MEKVSFLPALPTDMSPVTSKVSETNDWTACLAEDIQAWNSLFAFKESKDDSQINHITSEEDMMKKLKQKERRGSFYQTTFVDSRKSSCDGETRYVQ